MSKTIRESLGPVHERNAATIIDEATPQFEVKYSSSKRGPIKVTKFMTQDEAQAFLKKIRGEGMNGIVSKGGKPVRTPMKEDAKSDRLAKIERAAKAREKDQAAQKKKATEKHNRASAKSREAVKHFGNKDQFGRPKNEEIEQVDEAKSTYKLKKTKTEKVTDAGDYGNETQLIVHFDVMQGGKKVGRVQVDDYFGTMLGNLHGKNLPKLYGHPNTAQKDFDKFIKSKTFQKRFSESFMAEAKKTIKLSSGDVVEIGKIDRGNGKTHYYWKHKSGLKNMFSTLEKMRYSLRNDGNFKGAEKVTKQLGESLRQRADDSMTFSNRQAAFSTAFKKKHGRKPTKQELRDAGVGKGGDNPAGAKAYQKAMSKLRPASRSGIKDKFVHNEEIEQVDEAAPKASAKMMANTQSQKKLRARIEKNKRTENEIESRKQLRNRIIKKKTNEDIEQVDEGRRRGMIDDEGYRRDSRGREYNPVDDRIRARNAARHRAEAEAKRKKAEAERKKKEKTNESVGITEDDKAEYNKLMDKYGDMPMSKVPMKARLRIRELGRSVRGDKGGPTAGDLVKSMKRRRMGEGIISKIKKTMNKEKDERQKRIERFQKSGRGLKKSDLTPEQLASLKGHTAAIGRRIGEDVEQVEEAVDGWIAMYNGKKVEIKKGEAKDLYAAKLKAIQMLKVPKSKQGLLAIKPAVNEEVEVAEAGMIGRTKPSRELNVQKDEKPHLAGVKSLKYQKRAAHKAERKKGKQDIKKDEG
tara:strand:- start:20226 stop:22472 length:2247 start_codon:yes stop_codon:yes gene_type:complete